MKKIMLLGSGELGKEFVIAAQRLGQTVVACDSYAGAPAMQVADACEVFHMLDGDALAAAVGKHRPDIIVPKSRRSAPNGSTSSKRRACRSCRAPAPSTSR